MSPLMPERHSDPRHALNIAIRTSRTARTRARWRPNASGAPCGFSSTAASAGDSVSETIREITVDTGDGQRELR
jgi:hypothetical protein